MGNWSDDLDDGLITKYDLDIVSIPASKQIYLFWLLMHLCTDTALRLISLDKATENGHAAFQ